MLHPENSNIIIHHFSSKRPSDAGVSPSILLEGGRRLVLQAIGNTTVWHSRVYATQLSSPTGHFQYIYSTIPPLISGTRSTVLKDWGSPVEEDEVFRLEDLPEFSGTDFALASNRQPSLTSDPSPVSTPREKIKLDHGSLNQLIPQPHILPSPVRISTRQIKNSHYRKSKPIMIPPYVLPLVEFNEWSRSAWVIPIRGKLPWAASTSGVLLEPLQDLPAFSKTPTNNELVWSPNAVLKFWDFLVKIREAGHLGHLGISFHPVSSPSVEKSLRISRTISTAPTEMNESWVSTSPMRISSVDHIKIYHDWPLSSQLRNVLDAWSFESEKRKIRLFVGARLVLLDEKSRGVMIL